MIVGVMGTALITPLYALYKEAWHLQASDISLVYVIYMGGALCALLSVGRLPDRLGFGKVLRWGLSLAMAGTFVSLLARNMAVLSAGRFLVGIASSMVVTSAASGFSKLGGTANPQRMATLNSFLIAFGFGLGPLLGGAMGQWAPAPLVTTYVPTLVLGTIALVGLGRIQLPEDPSRPSAALGWRDLLPRFTWPAAADSRAFLLTSVLPFVSFGVFGLYASMAPLFLDKLVPWHGPVVSGTAVAFILMSSAVVQVVASRVPTHWCGCFGMLGLAASNALLMANLWAGSSTLFVLGVLFTAAGHGMSMLAGMSMVTRLAPPGKRSGLIASYLVAGYVGSMVPMLGVGWIADHWGLNAAVSIFCAFVIATGVTVAVLFQRHPRMRPQEA